MKSISYSTIKSVYEKKRSVRICSVAGHFAETLPVPLGMYCPSKYALTALSTELRHEIIAAKLNIRVTVRCYFALTFSLGAVDIGKHLLTLSRVTRTSDSIRIILNVETININTLTATEILSVLRKTYLS